MRLLLVLVVILSSAAPASADFVYKLVGYECDAQQGAVVLTYRAALNDAGQKMLEKKGPRQWDPWALITKTEDGNLVRAQQTVHGQCTLPDGIYDITIGPAPGNTNLQGMCGGFITAWAEVRRGGEIVFARQTFEHPDCHAAEPVITKVVIGAGRGKPVVTKVPFEEFVK